MLDISNFQTTVSESSSKGNQTKFYNEGYWYKLDSYNCQQGLAENFVSRLCDCIKDFPYVPYQSLQVLYKDEIYNACCSPNMYNSDVTFISLRKLFKNNNIPLRIFTENENITSNIYNVLCKTEQLTGLDLLHYFNNLLFLDALILNEDRHYMNLGVCMSNSEYKIAPCFDNGSSLFCVNWTYRKTKSFQENLDRAKSCARPFSKFYDKQIKALQELKAQPIQINALALSYLLNTYNNKLYTKEQNQLIKNILLARLNYYAYKEVFVYV